jgi:hypothetical protein
VLVILTGHIFFFNFFILCKCSKVEHPGIVKLVAAHARPPNYMFFFEFYESLNLADKIHREEWIPDIYQVLMITVRLGIICLFLSNLMFY